MVSRILTSAAATLAALSFAGFASANCGSSLYCGQSGHANGHSTLPSLSSWSANSAQATTGASYAMHGTSSRYSPSTAYSSMSASQADANYGTGSISQTYSSYETQAFSGSTSSVQGLGHNESLQATNCPVNVHGVDEGRVIGCYNVVKPIPQTTYYRVVRPIVYVRYPVPVAVPYTTPCLTVKHYSRYGNWHTGGYRGGCR